MAFGSIRFRLWKANVLSQNSKRWQPLRSKSNPPSSPFFKGGVFRCGISNPSLKKFEKEGKGRFLDGMTGNYVANFRVRTPSHRRMSRLLPLAGNGLWSKPH